MLDSQKARRTSARDQTPPKFSSSSQNQTKNANFASHPCAHTRETMARIVLKYAQSQRKQETPPLFEKEKERYNSSLSHQIRPHVTNFYRACATKFGTHVRICPTRATTL